MLMGALAALFLMPRHAAAVDLTMYYPVAVGGPVTKIIDDMVGRFEKENADIKVTAVYAGNYTDTMTKDPPANYRCKARAFGLMV